MSKTQSEEDNQKSLDQFEREFLALSEMDNEPESQPVDQPETDEQKTDTDLKTDDSDTLNPEEISQEQITDPDTVQTKSVDSDTETAREIARLKSWHGRIKKMSSEYGIDINVNLDTTDESELAQINAELRKAEKQIDEKRKSAKKPEAPATTETGDDPDLDQFPEIKKVNEKIDRLIDANKQNELRQAEMQQEAVRRNHEDAILSKHHDAFEIVNSDKFGQFLDEIPGKFSREYTIVLEQGDANQCIQMIDHFKDWEKPKQEPKPKTSENSDVLDGIRTRRGSDPKLTASPSDDDFESVFNRITSE